jgi:hypothetical protein
MNALIRLVPAQRRNSDMQEKARVVSIDGDVVSVVPLDIEMCIGCSNTECQKNGNVFTACNSGNLDIYPGAEVRIRARGKNQAVQGLLSIGVPVLAAAAGYALVGGFAPAASEGVRIGASLGFLVAAGTLVALFRRTGSTDLPEIYEVVAN